MENLTNFTLEMFQLSNGTLVPKKPHIHHFICLSVTFTEGKRYIENVIDRNKVIFNLIKEVVLGPIASILMISYNCPS